MSWIGLLLLGCTSSGDATDEVEETDAVETDETDEDPVETVELDELITLTTATTSDMTCLGAEGTWMQQTVDPSCVATVPVDGRIRDFQTNEGVANSTIEMWFDDRMEGDPDVTMTSDLSGKVQGADAPTCTAWTARMSTPPERGETKDVVQYHFVEPHASPMRAFYNSVSVGTYALMPAILGVTATEGLGVIAGTVYHCGGMGKTAEGVQVAVRREGGGYPASQVVKYFVDEFPSRDQPQTSEDGLWLAIDLPPGKVVVEAYAILADGGAPRLIGQTSLEIFPDSLHVADIYTNSGDGVVFPESCLAPCEVL